MGDVSHLEALDALDTGDEAAGGGVPLRVVTATSLFDGHDAAINIMRRLMQGMGAEVVHLGHNRSVEEIVRAALQEDADAIAVSSYQGGHVEFFTYMIDMLRENGASDVAVFGGGGGTITHEEIAQLQAYGVQRLYHPDDGMQLGLTGIIEDLLGRARSVAHRRRRQERDAPIVNPELLDDDRAIGRALTRIERGDATAAARASRAPVIGITGTGGAGKSTVVDELLSRFLQAYPSQRVAVLAVDPTRRRTGGALLGDRIRMNSLRSPRVFMRSMATRGQNRATSPALRACVSYLRDAGFGLVLVETAGIGQSDSEIVDLADVSMYVMTSEFGAPSQLEKIDMLDLADLIVLNKKDRHGSEDALRDIRKQWRRNRNAFHDPNEHLPVYPTTANRFNDAGVTALFEALSRRLHDQYGFPEAVRALDVPDAGSDDPLVPRDRIRYLSEIASQARGVDADIKRMCNAAALAQSCWNALGTLNDAKRPPACDLYAAEDLRDARDDSLLALRRQYQQAIESLTPEALRLLREWPERLASVRAPEYAYEVRGRQVRGSNYVESLSQQQIPKIAPPTHTHWDELLRFLLRENLPGAYPYTAGVYPYRRTGEDPIRMFAGEGTPERTNRRFHYLARGQQTVRLSTAFDSVTLYGEDPHPRPDIYGKVGNSGVSIASLDDMKKLYAGFDLNSPSTSVSMTINGPAPTILAMFMNTAIDQAVEKHLRADSARWTDVQAKLASIFRHRERPRYAGTVPTDDDLGLALLGVSGDELVDRTTYERIKDETVRQVRGTVQADILKEDQAQNTCIFSTEFSLRAMGDIQQHFIDHAVRNFYSVSISGYHIAEAGANPITQLAFTLANGLTIVEYYLSRGMHVDDFAPNLSFFFSNGMDPEYSVIGRVARRIWARAMRERYGANARSQMLKYHVQTSGRSLHAQEIEFNDVRTTLQALYALVDNCNSLHTNAYDEAITTPTEQSVRRAVAIQLIINREFGFNFCENAWQGSFAIDALTEIVEKAVYAEFDALSARGGVLGAMETMYQRGKIQEESLYYERKKHDGSLPVIGVNTFLPASDNAGRKALSALVRSTVEEREQQVANVEAFRRERNRIPVERSGADGNGTLAWLQRTAQTGGNVFGALMEAVKFYSLGQISGALYEIGGEYRRNM
jgi:isobutyryl-CoA mutase